MRPPCVPNEDDRKVSLPSKYNTVDRNLARGKCPYKGKWRSGLDSCIRWPPIDVRIFEDNELCHTTCTCSNCSSTGQPPGPPPDPEAPAHLEPALPLVDGFVSCEEDEDDPVVDRTALAELYNIFAPISVTANADPSASSTPGASSSTAAITEQSVLIAYDNMQQQISRRATAASSTAASSSDCPPVAAPLPTVKRKSSAFVMGKRGRGLIQQSG